MLTLQFFPFELACLIYCFVLAFLYLMPVSFPDLLPASFQDFVPASVPDFVPASFQDFVPASVPDFLPSNPILTSLSTPPVYPPAIGFSTPLPFLGVIT